MTATDPVRYPPAEFGDDEMVEVMLTGIVARKLDEVLRGRGLYLIEQPELGGQNGEPRWFFVALSDDLWRMAKAMEPGDG